MVVVSVLLLLLLLLLLLMLMLMVNCGLLFNENQHLTQYLCLHALRNLRNAIPCSCSLLMPDLCCVVILRLLASVGWWSTQYHCYFSCKFNSCKFSMLITDLQKYLVCLATV